VEFLPASFSFTPRPPQNESDETMKVMTAATEIHVAVAPVLLSKSKSSSTITNMNIS
jgi:hypothetical protein